MKYKYTGDIEIHLQGYGQVKPEEVIEVDFEIVHPLFKEVKTSEKVDKGSK